MLGRPPTYAELQFRLGPGATIGVPKAKANPRTKLGSELTCSSELSPVLLPILYELEGLVAAYCGDDELAVFTVRVEPGVVDFAPKKFDIDRVIIKEPLLNTMCQLGALDYVTPRLKRRGLDLTDQTRNQRLAAEGSITDALATSDLSSASDLNAIELVYHQLPIYWAHLLSRFRTGD